MVLGFGLVFSEQQLGSHESAAAVCSSLLQMKVHTQVLGYF
jgi:hypothetical protein